MESALPMDAPLVKITLTVRSDGLALFFPLLQQGVGIRTRLGRSLKTVLCEETGYCIEDLETKVQTVFLEGKPVDDWDRAVVTEGATVALSAAMPGLVGATLRRGGFYASLRSGITHGERADATAAGEGVFTLKLFNLLVPEMGSYILEKGFFLQGSALSALIKNRPEDFRRVIQSIRLSGEDVPWPLFLEQLSRRESESLHVRIVPSR